MTIVVLGSNHITKRSTNLQMKAEEVEGTILLAWEKVFFVSILKELISAKLF